MKAKHTIAVNNTGGGDQEWHLLFFSVKLQIFSSDHHHLHMIYSCLHAGLIMTIEHENFKPDGFHSKLKFTNMGVQNLNNFPGPIAVNTFLNKN